MTILMNSAHTPGEILLIKVKGWFNQTLKSWLFIPSSAACEPADSVCLQAPPGRGPASPIQRRSPACAFVSIKGTTCREIINYFKADWVGL